MNELMTFDFEDQPVRTLIDPEGTEWWVAHDVCRCLEIEKPRNAYARLDDDEKGALTVGTPGGPQEMICVNEPGVYNLVFTSRSEASKRFKRWLAHEVIPALRRQGRYELPGAATQAGLGPDEEREWLAHVREVRLTFGIRAARALWQRSPLPQIPEELADSLDKSRGADAGVNEVIAAQLDAVRAFLAECTEPVQGERIQARKLYLAYCAWCADDAEKPMTNTAFGLRLRECGVQRMRFGQRYYMDVALRSGFEVTPQ